MIAVAPEADKDGSRYRRPNQFQTIVPVAVGGAYSFLGAIFDQKIDVNNLRQDEDRPGEIVNKVGQLIDLLTALAGNIRHPPKTQRPLRSVSRYPGCNQYRNQQDNPSAPSC